MGCRIVCLCFPGVFWTHENGAADCLGLCCCLEGGFGHRAGFRAPDARLGKLVFGTSDKSGLPVAGSLVYIFICVAGVSECLRNSLKALLYCKKRVRRRRFIPRFPRVRLRERESWRRVDLSLCELIELRELRVLRRRRTEGHAGSALEGHAGSDLEGHTGSSAEGHGSVNRQSVASDMRGELLSCPCCSCRVNDEDRVFYLKALRSSGPQMRGVPRPGVSETFEPNMPDVEHVPNDGETSDIPAWGDLFPDDDEAGPSVVPKRPRKNAPLYSDPPDPNDPPPLGGEDVEEPRIPLNSVALRVHNKRMAMLLLTGTAQVVCVRGVRYRREDFVGSCRKRIKRSAGKLRVLLVVHLSSHYVLALPAVDLRDKTLEHNFDRFVREVGLTGKTVTVRCDNEVSLLAAAEHLTARSTVSRAVIDPVAGYRPQSKGGVERMVAVVKQSFWSVWLDLELEGTRSQSVEAETRLPLGGLLWQAALLYTCRCHNLWHAGINDVTTPIDRVHEQIVQRTRTFAFGSVVLAKTSRVKRTWLSFEGRIGLSAHIWDLCVHAEVEFLHVLKAVVRSKFSRRVVRWQMPIQLMIVGL